LKKETGYAKYKKRIAREKRKEKRELADEINRGMQWDLPNDSRID